MSIKYNQPSFFQYSIIYTATISQISLPPTSVFLERDSPFQSLDMEKKKIEENLRAGHPHTQESSL